MPEVRVAALKELPPGGMLAVDVGELEILLARIGDTVLAISNICSHDEVWLDAGTLHERSCEVECPMHEGRFDLRSGAATHEPCTTGVPSYPARVDGDAIWLEVP